MSFENLDGNPVNESFEKVATYGLMPNMIFYLMKDYHMDATTGTTIILLWSATSNALAMVGAFLSDSYLGRFRGMILLWLIVMVPETKPPPYCNPSDGSCKSASAAQLALLFSSFGLMSIGACCIRPCSIAFGADQLTKKDDPKNEGLLQSFFNWFYVFTRVSTIFALTVIVYILKTIWAGKIAIAVPVKIFGIVIAVACEERTAGSGSIMGRRNFLLVALVIVCNK
ncbi:hypothetical protein NE237_022315 [Protea cynaroides]|uniref:Uncharacterized protein n=1 Tax=Protea cynaroides TaxID=273540 RepID=A0A9Q0H9D7_9MAGN|nr:hypothetical protein NE237_022315 [Protea cynaroides]